MLMSRERSLRWGKEEIDVKVMRLTGEQEIYTWYYFVRYFEPFDAKRHTKGWK